jgi:hypothetical protein
LVKTVANGHEIEQAAAIAPPYAGYGFPPLRMIRGANARKLTMSPPSPVRDRKRGRSVGPVRMGEEPSELVVAADIDIRLLG